MSSNKLPEKPSKEQRDRFIEAATELGTDDDPAAFDTLFNKLVRPMLPEPADKPKAD